MAALSTSGGAELEAAPSSMVLDELLEVDELTDTLAFLSAAACHGNRTKSISAEYCASSIQKELPPRHNRLFLSSREQ